MLNTSNNIDRLLGVVNACIFIYHALPELDITDFEVKKALAYVSRRCNELYEAELDVVFNSSDNG